MVEEDERADHAALGERQDAADLEAAEVAAALADDELDHAQALRIRTFLARRRNHDFENPVAIAAAAMTNAVSAQECKPLESREPNVPDQRPAFPGQTRACEERSNVGFNVVVLAKGLERPWAVEPLPGGELLVTEKPGRAHRVREGRGGRADCRGAASGRARAGRAARRRAEPGLRVRPHHLLQLHRAARRRQWNGRRTRRAVRQYAARRAGHLACADYNGTMHYGSRLAFGPDGMLYVSTGERSDMPMRKYAQQPDSGLGKIVRVAPDGSGSEIWTLGHRNVQAMAFDAEGRLWVVEHGARGGDELNLIERGKNYGWPLVAYGEEYSGEPFPGAVTAMPGYEQPVYYWDPDRAFRRAVLQREAFPEWRRQPLHRRLERHEARPRAPRERQVVGEEHLLAERGQRVRDVREGPAACCTC